MEWRLGSNGADESEGAVENRRDPSPAFEVSKGTKGNGVKGMYLSYSSSTGRGDGVEGDLAMDTVYPCSGVRMGQAEEEGAG